MRTRIWLALGSLLGVLALAVGLTPAAPPKPRTPETFTQRLARESKLSEENVNKVYQALGPVIRDEISQGKTVSIPGLGSFRVVRVEAHRDLRGGRPVEIPAANTVEFVSEGQVIEAANNPGVQPAEVVPPFEFHPLPTQTPAQRTGNVRNPGIRTP